MLLTPKNLPMSNGGLPWGTIIFVAVIVCGVSYIGYQAMQPPVIIPNPKTKENERG